MQNATLWRGLLGLENAVVEDVEFDEDGGVLVASVRPSKGKRNRCGQCPRRCPSYDAGSGRRRWRALDLGSVQVFVEADAPRVTCRDHGVVVASVPWARHDAGHTRAFDEQVAWLATKTSKTAVTELMRVAWRTVGSIIERVWDDTEGLFDRFADLTRIGIDEISYKRGHKYSRSRGGPRVGTAGLGCAGPRHRDAHLVRRCAGRGPVRPHHPRVRGRRELDRQCCQGEMPECDPLRRPVPYRQMGHRRPRHGSPPDMDRGPQAGQDQ